MKFKAGQKVIHCTKGAGTILKNQILSFSDGNSMEFYLVSFNQYGTEITVFMPVKTALKYLKIPNEK